MTRLTPHPLVRAGSILSLLLLLVGFVSVIWTPFPVGGIDAAAAMQGPGNGHLLGTDGLGRDMLSLSMKGLLTSFVVSAVGLAIGLFAGLPLALAGSRWRPWASRPIAFLALVLILVAMPGLALALALHLGPSPISAMLAIGAFDTGVLALLLPQLFVRLAERDGVQASRLAGLRGWELVRRRLSADLVAGLGRLVVLLFACGALAEAGLSFLGLSAQPTGNSLGLMLREARPVMMAQPLLVLVPAAALSLLVLGCGLLALGLDRSREARA